MDFLAISLELNIVDLINCIYSLPASIFTSVGTKFDSGTMYINRVVCVFMFAYYWNSSSFEKGGDFRRQHCPGILPYSVHSNELAGALGACIVSC